MRNPVLAALLALVASTGALAAGIPTMSFGEVRPGMRGQGRTVFDGTSIETFDVEIVGTLPNIGPDQDLILGRCSGGPLSDTGVLAGMSGSPIYVEGKLIGALAYSWSFSKEPIAGITPIAEMLDIVSVDERGTRRPSASTPIGVDDLRRLVEPEGVATFLAEELPSRLRLPGGAEPLAVPLTVAGLGARGFSRLASRLGRVGFLPVQGAGAGRSAEPSAKLEPGAAVGLKLIRGDLDLTATGTVTWVDGDRVLAFGHPLLGLGAIDLPLTGARVEVLLSSLERSSRMATPLGEVGAVRQDRSAGVLGRLGAQPRMLPVRVELEARRGDGYRYSFDVADDPLLSPILLFASLEAILASREGGFGSATLRLREGSVIKMVGQDDVRLDNLFAGPTAFQFSSGLPAYILYLLMNNSWERPQIAGVNILLEYDDVPQTGRIERVSLDRYRASPGDTVQVSVTLGPYRGRRQVKTAEITIPPETPPGRLILHVGGAMAVSRAESTGEPILPGGLSQFIWLINNLRRNDRVYIAAYREDSGVWLDGARLPNLPPSVAGILSRPRSVGNFSVVRQRGVFEEEIGTEYAVEGLARIPLEVVEP